MTVWPRRKTGTIELSEGLCTLLASPVLPLTHSTDSVIIGPNAGFLNRKED